MRELPLYHSVLLGVVENAYRNRLISHFAKKSPGSYPRAKWIGSIARQETRINVSNQFSSSRLSSRLEMAISKNSIAFALEQITATDAMSPVVDGWHIAKVRSSSVFNARSLPRLVSIPFLYTSGLFVFMLSSLLVALVHKYRTPVYTQVHIIWGGSAGESPAVKPGVNLCQLRDRNRCLSFASVSSRSSASLQKCTMF